MIVRWSRIAELLPVLALLTALFVPAEERRPRSVLYFFDRSGSMGSDLRGLARAQRWWLEGECARAAPDDRVACAVFGAGVELISDWHRAAALDWKQIESGLAQDRPALATDTRIDGRFGALIRALARDGGVDEVRVISDGWLTAPAELDASDPRFEWIEWAVDEPNDVAIEWHAPPERAPPNATMRLRCRYARLGNCRQAEVAIECLLNGVALLQRRLTAEDLDRGEIEIEFETSRAGQMSLEIAARANGDQVASNDRSTCSVVIDGTRRIATVGGTPASLSDGAVAFVPVTSGNLEDQLPNFDALWIDEARAAELPASAIHAFVERGGGLVISGLELQLDSGGYDTAPWAELLPVDIARENGLEEVLVLLDASGSMAGERFQEALSALDRLREEWGTSLDVRVAVFAESVGPWLSLKDRGARVASLARDLFPSHAPHGATHLVRAVEDALRQRRATRSAVFLLSDGQEEDPAIADPFAAAEALAQRLLNERVRLYALAIGGAADLAWLRRLVKDGQAGIARRVADVEQIAAGLRQGLQAGRIVSEATYPMAGVLPDSFPAALSKWPTYRRAQLRPGARAAYATVGGDPLVAYHARGAGRVAWVATGGGEGRVALAEPGFAMAIAAWSAGSAPAESLTISTGSERVLRLDRAQDPGALGSVAARWVAEGGKELGLSLLRSGPRSFEAPLPGRSAGWLTIADQTPRRISEASGTEMLPFAPRWAFRGSHALRTPQPRRRAALPSIWLLLLAVVFMSSSVWRWGRGSSPLGTEPKSRE